MTAPTRGALWGTCLLAAVLLHVLRTPIGTADFFWNAAIGRDIAAAGAIPTTDTYSVTMSGAPFVYVGWLAELILFEIHRAGGPFAVLLATGVAVLSALTCVVVAAARQTRNGAVAVVVALVAALLAGDNWAPRPQTFAWPIGAAIVLLVEPLFDDERSSGSEREERLALRRLVLVPLLVALFANLHGAFPVALLFVGAAALARSASDLRHGALSKGAKLALLTFLLSLLAPLANPRGAFMLGYFRGFGPGGVVGRYATEWQAVPVASFSGAVLVALPAVLAVLCVRRARGGAGSPVSRLGVGFLTLSLVAALLYVAAWTSMRHKLWLALVVPPLFARLAGTFLEEGAVAPFDRIARKVTMMLSVALALAFSLPKSPLRGSAPLYEDPTLGDAVDALSRACPTATRSFSNLVYASYLMYAAKTVKSVVDVRMDLYPPEVFSEYLATARGERDLPAYFMRWGLDAAIVDKESERGILAKLAGVPGLVTVYEDRRVLVACRR